MARTGSADNGLDYPRCVSFGATATRFPVRQKDRLLFLPAIQ
jgi:hypothetical protein